MEKLVRELPKGLIKWYEFHKDEKAMVVTSGTRNDAVMREALEECGLHVICMDREALEKGYSAPGEKDGGFRYIIGAGCLERSKDPQRLLENIRKRLNGEGTLLLAADNRLGIRYFCGDKDAFTGRSFDGIENYERIKPGGQEGLKGRAYAKAELTGYLEKAGFLRHRFYSVFPVIDNPQMIFAEDYEPKEELPVRIFPQYNDPDTVFLEEEKLYTTLIKNGLFHAMANGYLIECPLCGVFANAGQVTVSMERGKRNAMYTVVRRDGKVEKRPAYAEGTEKLRQLMDNNRYLISRGIPVVDAWLEGDAFVMPYVHGESAVKYLRRLLVSDQKAFLEKLEDIWQLILASSDHVPYSEINWEQYEPGFEKRKADDPAKDRWKRLACGTEEEKKSIGVILRRGYIDLVPLNCFYNNGAFIYYDQELYMEKLPAKAILLRTIDIIYMSNTKAQAVIPREELLTRYGLLRCKDLFSRFVKKYLDELRNDRLLAVYHKTVRRDAGVINSNRQRMNYSVDEYERLFRDIFRGTGGRGIYLFGSGNFTKVFLSQFGEACEIKGILDNNEEKWGTKLEGILVSSPEILTHMRADSYKVIICIKNYIPVMRQLDRLGIREYSIYDSSLKYSRIKKTDKGLSGVMKREGKRYRTGYIAGVFDLFHVGHLNMLKRASEQCEYLIAGVVNDEGVMKNKKTMPFVPFEERIAMVRSCRYVDETVEIPTEYNDTEEAYRRYQFDVQFSGSDYADDPLWLAKQAYLRKHGSDLVFFPYTETTSSTKLKGLINKKLL